MKLISNNKKAFHDYFISETYETGIVLEGSEVKSIRDGGISLNESFITINDNEVFLRNAYIKPYEKSSAYSPDSRKSRKLLLHKKEIAKLKKHIEADGCAVVPIKVYFERGHVKLEIGVGKGKKLYDKRETLKEKTSQREIQREMSKRMKA